MKTKHQKKVKKFNDILKARNIGTNVQIGNQYDIGFLKNTTILNNIKNVSNHDSDIIEEYIIKPISPEELSKKYFSYQMRILLHSSIMNLPEIEHKKSDNTQRNNNINRFSEIESNCFQKDLIPQTRKIRDKNNDKDLNDIILSDDYFHKNNNILEEAVGRNF